MVEVMCISGSSTSLIATLQSVQADRGKHPILLCAKLRHLSCVWGGRHQRQLKCSEEDLICVIACPGLGFGKHPGDHPGQGASSTP